jgi:DNA modification methylase
MKTRHQVLFQNANDLSRVPDETVDLVITSPPYPMIQMWDDIFSEQNPKITDLVEKNNGSGAFELMHRVLDPAWKEVHRVLKTGGIACINIGDAARTINDNFALYQNHTRLMRRLLDLGFSSLPAIVWRKQTNAPNKFMGSGMLPPGAYVTLEHEYILIVRKGGKRKFTDDAQKQSRRESAFFWEERNLWFSDVWMDLKGAGQNSYNEAVRSRSANYPFDLPYRLVNMFSIKGDVVMDPFLGVGTSMFAAMAAGRNSIGVELDANYKNHILSRLETIVPFSNERIRKRIKNHFRFVEEYAYTKGGFKYLNSHYRFPVMTRQETDLLLNTVLSVTIVNATTFELAYSDEPEPEFCRNWEPFILPAGEKPRPAKSQPVQLTLLD